MKIYLAGAVESDVVRILSRAALHEGSRSLHGPESNKAKKKKHKT